jgi:hypothetical protein
LSVALKGHRKLFVNVLSSSRASSGNTSASTWWLGFTGSLPLSFGLSVGVLVIEVHHVRDESLLVSRPFGRKVPVKHCAAQQVLEGPAQPTLPWCLFLGRFNHRCSGTTDYNSALNRLIAAGMRLNYSQHQLFDAIIRGLGGHCSTWHISIC